MRFENNRKKGVTNSKIGGQSDEVTDLNGIGAELSFCKMFNVFPDLSISTRSSTNGEDTGDAVLHNGKTIDIKATVYPCGKLLAVPWKQEKVDLFALMVGTFPTYTFKGFMRAPELLKKERIGDLGHGETYIAYQNELLSLEQIESGAPIPDLSLPFCDDALADL
jgi:hypothetical protein